MNYHVHGPVVVLVLGEPAHYFESLEETTISLKSSIVSDWWANPRDIVLSWKWREIKKKVQIQISGIQL